MFGNPGFDLVGVQAIRGPTPVKASQTADFPNNQYVYHSLVVWHLRPPLAFNLSQQAKYQEFCNKIEHLVRPFNNQPHPAHAWVKLINTMVVLKISYML